LSVSDTQFNSKLASCHRLKNSWLICTRRFKVSDESEEYKKISLIITNCLYLTSFMVTYSPLRSTDKTANDKFMKHYEVKQNSVTEKKEN